MFTELGRDEAWRLVLPARWGVGMRRMLFVPVRGGTIAPARTSRKLERAICCWPEAVIPNHRYRMGFGRQGSGEFLGAMLVGMRVS